MAATQNLHCSVITPEERVLDANATSVILPAHDGLVGVLNGRAPLLCELGIGVLHVDTTDAGPRDFYVDGGFAQVLNNEVTVLTERAAPAERLNRAEAEKALSAAEALTAKDEETAEARRKAIERAKVKLKLATK